MTVKTSTEKPLPLSNILQDLAHLRASGINTSELFKVEGRDHGAGQMDIEGSVAVSHEFVRAAKAAMKLCDSGKVETEGGRLEGVRTEIEEALEGVRIR